MSDLISRQAAIDALDVLCQEHRYKIPGKRETYSQYNEAWQDALDRAEGVIGNLPSAQPDLQPTCNQLATDCISRQEVIDEISHLINENDKVKIGTSSFRDGIIDGYARVRSMVKSMPSAQPERTCVNCGRTVNNGGWYADGRTRCPIEEHYALPKDGYCHLWEKRNVTDDDYPERREE